MRFHPTKRTFTSPNPVKLAINEGNSKIQGWLHKETQVGRLGSQSLEQPVSDLTSRFFVTIFPNNLNSFAFWVRCECGAPWCRTARVACRTPPAARRVDRIIPWGDLVFHHRVWRKMGGAVTRYFFWDEYSQILAIADVNRRVLVPGILTHGYIRRGGEYLPGPSLRVNIARSSMSSNQNKDADLKETSRGRSS